MKRDAKFHEINIFFLYEASMLPYLWLITDKYNIITSVWNPNKFKEEDWPLSISRLTPSPLVSRIFSFIRRSRSALSSFDLASTAIVALSRSLSMVFSITCYRWKRPFFPVMGFSILVFRKHLLLQIRKCSMASHFLEFHKVGDRGHKYNMNAKVSNIWWTGAICWSWKFHVVNTHAMKIFWSTVLTFYHSVSHVQKVTKVRHQVCSGNRTTWQSLMPIPAVAWRMRQL